MKTYELGSKYDGIYFTRREAECMLHLINGKNPQEISLNLKLSIKTIEFYIKKMKVKLNCQSEAELVDKVLGSDFLKNID